MKKHKQKKNRQKHTELSQEVLDRIEADKRRIIEELVKEGMPREQAEAQAEAFS